MATCFSVFAWEMPRTGDSGGLKSMGSQRVRHDWAHRHIDLKKEKEGHYMMAHTLLRRKTFRFCTFSFSLNITAYHRKENYSL